MGPRVPSSEIIVSVMLNKGYIHLLLIVLFGVVIPHSATAQRSPADVRTLLEKRDGEIKALLGDKETFTDAQREALKKVINDGIDFAAMGRHALGKYWNDLTDSQRSDFVSVFSDIVRAQSLSNLAAYRAKVAYKKIDVDGDTAHVLTTTLYKKVEMKVAYVLGFHGAQWWVDDIVLDEVSTADGYARSFQALIRKKGFDTLMDRLHKRRDRIKKSS